MGILSKFFIKASDGEQVETVVRLAPDSRGIITGRVLNDDGKPCFRCMRIIIRYDGETVF